MDKKSVLIVEDNENLGLKLENIYLKRGYFVTIAPELDGVWKSLERSKFDLVIVDYDFDGKQGVRVCKAIKGSPLNMTTPILMLSPSKAERYEMAGIKAGVDELIKKPFSANVLIARSERLVSKVNNFGNNLSSTIRMNDFLLDFGLHRAEINQQAVHFTLLEFKILRVLHEAQGEALPREKLIQQAWPSDVRVVNRAVDVHINSIRKKLGQYGHLIQTVHGNGYRLLHNGFVS